MLRSRHPRLKAALTQGATLAFILATASSQVMASGAAPTAEAGPSQAAAAAPSGTPGTPNVKDPFLAGWLRLPFWPCVGYMMAGKFLRYLTMTGVLIYFWPT